MNEELIKLRGKYEILRDELQNVSSQLATEAKEINDWSSKFFYCDRSMCESILTTTKTEIAKTDIIINRTKRLKTLHDQATSIIEQLNDIRPLINK